MTQGSDKLSVCFDVPGWQCTHRHCHACLAFLIELGSSYRNSKAMMELSELLILKTIGDEYDLNQNKTLLKASLSQLRDQGDL